MGPDRVRIRRQAEQLLEESPLVFGQWYMVDRHRHQSHVSSLFTSLQSFDEVIPELLQDPGKAPVTLPGLMSLLLDFFQQLAQKLTTIHPVYVIHICDDHKLLFAS